jgi:membrane protease YdiL (CAAX protease family)
MDVAIMATGVVAAVLAAKPVRDRLARVLPMDPDNPVHAVALVLAVILLGTQVSATAFSDVLAADMKLPPLTVTDLFWQELPFLVLAAVGVGLYIRRDTPATGSRLGLVRPRLWHIALALAAAGAFFALSATSSYIGQQLTPDLADKVGRTDQHLFGGLGDWSGILAISLLPGICEEVLFRGALQPRFGILATAVLFTAIHTEYGLSVDLVTIFVLAIGLGLVRRYANTTACCVAHASFNFMTAASLPGTWLWAGIAAEVVLIGLVVVVVMRRARSSEQPMVDEATLG